MLATGFAIEMSFVAIGWQVYAVHSNPLDLGLVGLAMFIPLPLLALPAGHLADRFPRRTLLAIATALDVAVMVGLLFVTRAGAASTWPFFAARVRHRRRVGARCACLAGADAVARPARDPRAGARAAVDRVPGVRDHRACDRRPAVRDALGARLRRWRRRCRPSPSSGCCSSAPGVIRSVARHPTSRACSGASASCAGRPCCSAPSRSTSSPSCSAARSRCCPSSPRTCSMSGRPASACSGPRLPSARCARRSSSRAGPWAGTPAGRCSRSSASTGSRSSSSGSRR